MAATFFGLVFPTLADFVQWGKAGDSRAFAESIVPIAYLAHAIDAGPPRPIARPQLIERPDRAIDRVLWGHYCLYIRLVQLNDPDFPICLGCICCGEITRGECGAPECHAPVCGQCVVENRFCPCTYRGTALADVLNHFRAEAFGLLYPPLVENFFDLQPEEEIAEQ